MAGAGTQEERRWIISMAKETLDEMIENAERLLEDITYLTLENPELFTDSGVAIAAKAMSDAVTAAREALYGKQQ